MAIGGLNHITLAVSDLDRSVGFYRDGLGLRLRARWTEGAYLEAGSLWLCLSYDEKTGTARRTDYTHIAFSVSPEAFDAFRARVEKIAECWRDNRSEGASFYFLDPDGHKLELHVGSLQSRLDHYRRTRPEGMELYD